MTKREIAVRINNLTKKYRDFYALRGVNLVIEKNTIYGLLGSNGAGKSTLIHILTGLLKYNEGAVYLLGLEQNGHAQELKKKVAIVPQKISLYEDLTIHDNLFYFGKAYGYTKVEVERRIAQFQSLLQLGNLKRKVQHLSGGYQRRVSLAVSLIGDPELIILDEALVGIDLETRDIIVKLLLELKKTKTIIITTHSVRDAELLCDAMCFLHKGQVILEGETKKILEEHSQKNQTKVKVTFNDHSIVPEISNAFKDKKVQVTFLNNTLTLTFFSTDVNAMRIIDTIKRLPNSDTRIKDIEVHKPGLEELMLMLVKQRKE